MVCRSVEIEPQGAAKDDDYIVIKMALDQNASSLGLPETLPSAKGLGPLSRHKRRY